MKSPQFKSNGDVVADVVIVGTGVVGAMMAGAYVGLAIILIFTLGNDVDPSVRRLVMGLLRRDR